MAGVDLSFRGSKLSVASKFARTDTLFPVNHFADLPFSMPCTYYTLPSRSCRSRPVLSILILAPCVTKTTPLRMASTRLAMVLLTDDVLVLPPVRTTIAWVMFGVFFALLYVRPGPNPLVCRTHVCDF